MFFLGKVDYWLCLCLVVGAFLLWFEKDWRQGFVFYSLLVVGFVLMLGMLQDKLRRLRK